MRAINHALTGAVIGIVSANALVAIPASFASHFVLDVIPHHNTKGGDMTSTKFAVILTIDGLLCVALAIVLAIWRPAHWPLAIVGAFLAMSPDFMWVPKYLRAKRHLPAVAPRGIAKFHADIQWFQRPIGGSVELAWFMTAVWTLYVVGTYIKP